MFHNSKHNPAVDCPLPKGVSMVQLRHRGETNLP